MSAERNEAPVTCKRCGVETPARTYSTRDGQPITAADIAVVYGRHAAEIVALLDDGWTLDSAADHVMGLCGSWSCTHPQHRLDALMAEAEELRAQIARLKGSAA